MTNERTDATKCVTSLLRSQESLILAVHDIAWICHLHKILTQESIKMTNGQTDATKCAISLLRSQ